jgi:hypothetical protein
MPRRSPVGVQPGQRYRRRPLRPPAACSKAGSIAVCRGGAMLGALAIQAAGRSRGRQRRRTTARATSVLATDAFNWPGLTAPQRAPLALVDGAPHRRQKGARHALLRAVTVENYVVRCRRSVCEAGASIGKSVRCQCPEGHVGDGRANGRARGSVGSQIRASRTARSRTA